MVIRVHSLVILSALLLFGLVLGSWGPVHVAFGQNHEETVTYDYYVVAGYETAPTPPVLAPSPPGFHFELDPPFYNFGNITKVAGKDYLLEGDVSTVTGSAYATMNVTNLLGYDIVITNLTAEVTDGTETLRYFFIPAGMYFSGFTLVWIDTLDPFPIFPPIDEVNYYTGEVTVIRDLMVDWYTKAVRTLEPNDTQTGPGTLVGPDLNGDANATGHVAPIGLANGSTFTDYFGLIVFGDIAAGTEINATVTLALTYTIKPPPTLLSVIPFYVNEPEPGESFLANVTISNVTLGSFEFKLWYNASLLTATAVSPGAIFAGRLDYLETVYDLSVPGRVWYGGNVTGTPGLAIPGNATVALINFTAVEPGTSQLVLNDTAIHVRWDTQLIERAHWNEDASVTVISEFASLAFILLILMATSTVMLMVKTRKPSLLSL